MHKNITSEFQMVENLVSFLKKHGHTVRIECPNMGQSVDIVTEKDGFITCIEAKMKDWKRAIEQCETHLAVADYIYIAIASKTASEKLCRETARRGWGIYHCNKETGEIITVMLPVKNNKVWNAQRRVFLKNLNNINPE